MRGSGVQVPLWELTLGEHMKDILFAKPKTLSETEEHVIVKRKWWAVILLIIGGVILAGRVPNIPVFIPYVLFFFGHGGMQYRDWETDRKSTRLNSSHLKLSRMPSSA